MRTCGICGARTNRVVCSYCGAVKVENKHVNMKGIQLTKTGAKMVSDAAYEAAMTEDGSGVS